ncbi:MAG: hypothetical protein ACLFU8_05165 [Anaerolineales bacterium]
MNTLQILTSHFTVVAIIGAIYVVRLLLTFSRRMNEVTRMTRRYIWFRVGVLFLYLSLFSYILRCSAALTGKPQILLSPHFALLTFHLPLATGVSISLVVTLFYWAWLFRKH